MFDVTLKATAPLPAPVAPDVIVRNAALLVADHPQVLAVDTFTVPDDAAAGALRLVGAIE